MLKEIHTKIVGDFANPNTRPLLPFLPVGHSLVLVREPTNQYDSNAIAVKVDITPEMRAGLPDRTLADVEHLGYVPRVIAGQLTMVELKGGIKTADNKTSFAIQYEEVQA